MAYILVSEQIAPLPLTPLAFYFAAFGFSLWLAAIPLLFLLFPNGQLPSRRWRWLAVVVVFSFLVLAAFMWLSPSAVLVSVPSPFHNSAMLNGWADNLTSAAVIFIMLAILLSAFSVIVRGWRARGQERQQFKWLGLASVLTVLAFFFNTELVPLLPGVFDALLEAAAFAGVPLAVGVAVLVEVGQSVVEGEALVKLEAMKMEYTIRAAAAGVVAAVHYAPGNSVDADALLVAIAVD